MTEEREPRVSLSEAAYGRLRGDILACRLPPGRRLTEKQLAADLGVSIAPLRDALTRLDHEGLVRTLPRKGYQVAPLTPKSIDDLFVVWQIVGPELVRLGISQASEEQIAAAQAAFDELDRLGEAGEQSASRDVEVVNATFAILAEATGNSYLITIFQRLMGDMSRIRTLLLTADEPATGSAQGQAEHWVRRVLAERDPEAAAADARRYIGGVHQRVLQALVRWPSVMASEVSAPPPR